MLLMNSYYCLFVFTQRQRVPVHVTNECHDDMSETFLLFHSQSKKRYRKSFLLLKQNEALFCDIKHMLSHILMNIIQNKLYLSEFVLIVYFLKF